MRLADESVCIGPPEARASYLNIPSIISAAAITGGEAIHPGYGLLSENASFAEICRACGIVFIGPAPEAIRLMGDKAQAREIARQAGAPVVPGSEGPLAGLDDAVSLAGHIGYPVMLKAAAGGGGRGMRIVRSLAPCRRRWATARRRRAGLRLDHLYLEKFIEGARHVEVQMLGDRNGIRVHLGDRDCSVQRRHQKLVEESPAAAISPETRAGLRAPPCGGQRRRLRLRGHRGVPGRRDGELLLHGGQHPHPGRASRHRVVTGIDLVRGQIRIAAGEPLGYRQEHPRSGHAIECRINAEDPRRSCPRRGGSPAGCRPAGRASAWTAT